MNQQAKERSLKVLKRLGKKYKSYPPTGLTSWKTPWQYLFCVILSAQANDNQVNKVTRLLFKTFKNLDDFEHAHEEDIQNVIKSIGFFRSKARYLKHSSTILINKYKGKVPSSLYDLTTLPGVGRKTANVFQGVIFGKSEGIAVDTHVSRMSMRLGFTKKKIADQIEQDLMKLFDRENYHKINPILFWHGRTICLARKPACSNCNLIDICPSYQRY